MDDLIYNDCKMSGCDVTISEENRVAAVFPLNIFRKDKGENR